MIIAVLVAAMLATPVFAERPTLTYNLHASHKPTGPGVIDVFSAGESGNSFLTMKDWQDLFSGDITGIAYYTGIVLTKANGESHFIGYWTFDVVTLEGVGTGGLRIGVGHGNLWIESGSGELSSIRGTGTGTTTPTEFLIDLTIYINP